MPLAALGAWTRAAIAFTWAVARRSPRLTLGGALVLSTASVTYAIRRTGGASSTEDIGSEESAPPIAWCAEGLEPIAGGACYAAPTGADGKLPLLLYLHGIFEKGPLEEEERDRQRRVAKLATAKGFAVLALRGSEGACTQDPEKSQLVCWPSNERTADKAPAFVKGWEPALRAAARRHEPDARYVLGFSNGGYFAGLVAERGLYDADAFVVAHAGPVEPVKAAGNKPPLLLMSADDDLSQEGMVRFDDELTGLRWPHEHYVRDGGHALPDSDITTALVFFERTRKETLPLRPALGTRVPRARLAPRSGRTDAAADGGSVDAEGMEPVQAEPEGGLPLEPDAGE
jgi:dienelactone hydrolase